MDHRPRVAVIGGGAAGFFAALSTAHHHPSAQVTLFEKSNKLLAKVKVSGGGRCNVTNATFTPSALAKNYPRGGKQLKKAFSHFDGQDTVNWFERRGVHLHTEADNRMFPTTNDSQTIIDCLVQEAATAGVDIRLQSPVHSIYFGDTWQINGEAFDKVIVATGGSPKATGLEWLQKLGHRIVAPVPSLFTFNMPGNDVVRCMGVVVPNARVRIQGTKFLQQGPVLVTHWGMSGPAILKLSAWGARELAERDYRFTVQINWIGESNEQAVLEGLQGSLASMGKKQINNACPFDIPRRFWEYLIAKSGCDGNTPWNDLGKKERNRLLNTLLNDAFEVSGKTTFKEEFVTCGGVDLGDVNFNTMESRVTPGLFFAGEILDVDGVTGGFNFQAAWTTGFIAGKLGK
jgi:predicted Rossmann fold flavoprotein